MRQDGSHLKDGLASPPSMKMACKQLAVLGDNFKDCLLKHTFHEDSLQASMEADTLKDGLHKPTFHEGLACANRGLQSQGES